MLLAGVEFVHLSIHTPRIIGEDGSVMKIVLEVSMYAFTEEFEREVLVFLEKLHGYDDLTIRVNTLSTQIYGEFDRVMEAVQTSIHSVFSNDVKASFVMKVLPGELDPDYRYDG